MILRASFLLAAIGSGDEPLPLPAEVDVSSGGGRAVAEIRRSRSRSRSRTPWNATMFALVEGRRARLWQTEFDWPSQATAVWIGDDARVLALIDPVFRQSDPLLWLLQPGRDASTVRASQLQLRYGDLAHGPTGRQWLLPEEGPIEFRWMETPAGPRPVLELACTDGWSRAVSLDDGHVIPDHDWPPDDPWVEPSGTSNPPHDRMFVNEFWLPLAIEVGAPAEIDVRGLPPTLGWNLEGFEFVWERPSRLHLTPWGRRLITDEGHHPAPQSCEFTATIHGLPSGRYQVFVHGLDGSEVPGSQDLVVMPPTSLVSLSTYGDGGRVDESVTVFPDGLAKFTAPHAPPNYQPIPADTLARIVELVATLPTNSDPWWRDDPALTLSYELTFRFHDEWAVVLVDDGGLQGTIKVLVELLRDLGPGSTIDTSARDR